MTNPSIAPDPHGDRGQGVPASGSTGVGSSGGGIGDFSEGYDSGFSSTGDNAGQSSSTKDVAKEEAGHTKQAAAGAAQQVAGTAKDELSNVTSEVGSQAKDLLDQTRGQVREQLHTQQSKLAAGIHAVAKELGSMGASSDSPGIASDLAQQASRKVGEVGHWVDNREPAEVLDEVKNFARRKPAVFLIGAALTGVLVGRLTRSAGAVVKADHAPATGSGSAAAGTNYATTTDYTTPSYTAEPAGYSTEGYSTGTGTGYSTGSTYSSEGQTVPGNYGRGGVTP